MVLQFIIHCKKMVPLVTVPFDEYVIVTFPAPYKPCNHEMVFQSVQKAIQAEIGH